MHASELAVAAVRVMAEDGPVASGSKSAVQELVWGRLGRSDLGASALPAAAGTTPPVSAAAPGVRGRAASGAVPQPPRQAGARAEETVRAVLMVWLLGLPQAVLAYFIIGLEARNGASMPLQGTILVVSACLAGYAL
ncbi:hypothetical protein AB0L33_13935 [Streptomyces sp. NPDC052299]|uniref:hypothetical protein n=1 Tax=Streptomyces sp. NPDC052299 TaxID=3155054 RepID=UPI0034394925